MSLINDALKQTRQSRPQNPPSHPPPLAPVASACQSGGSWLAPVIILLLFAAAGIFIGLSLSKHAPSAASTPLLAATRKAATAVPSVVAHPPPDTITATTTPPKPPELKLQGILFAAARPCAIVSGKTVFVGDHVGEFRVAAILKNSITLQSGSATKVLSLSPQ